MVTYCIARRWLDSHLSFLRIVYTMKQKAVTGLNQQFSMKKLLFGQDRVLGIDSEYKFIEKMKAGNMKT